MKKAKINLNGLVSVTKEVHGVQVRGLNAADLSTVWNTNGKSMMDAYDQIVAVADTNDTIAVINAIIKFAPDLAKSAFLAAINDDGEQHEVNGEMLTAGEVWDTKMSIGKQANFLIAIFELTLSENDNLKKKLAAFAQRLPAMQTATGTPQTATQKVQTAITQ